MPKTDFSKITSPMPAQYVGTHMEAAFKNYVAELVQTAKKADALHDMVSQGVDHEVIGTGGSDYIVYRENHRLFSLAMVHLQMSQITADLIPLLGPEWDRLHWDMDNLTRSYDAITAALTQDLPDDTDYLLRMTFGDLCHLLREKYNAYPAPMEPPSYGCPLCEAEAEA